MFSKKQIGIVSLAVLISVLVYYWFGYYMDRAHFGEYLTGMVLAFGCYVVIYRWIPYRTIGYIMSLAIALRLVFLFALPSLSDDYHRFVWDGRLIKNVVSPYQYTPSEVPDTLQQRIDPGGQLITGMNSQDYHSIYPPMHQGVFVLSAVVGDDVLESVVAMRLVLLLAEALLILSLFKIGSRIDRPKAAVLYAFNPLVITEITGNLHFEGIIALFLVVGVWAIQRKRHLISGILIGTAAAVKLTPFIYFPAIIKYLAPPRKGWGWLFAALLTFGIAGWWIFPLNEWSRLGTSVELYFQSFEFNASFYYLARSAGIAILDYNPIATTGWLLPLIGMFVILIISFQGKNGGLNNVAGRLTLIGTVYLLFATTVHPWYLVPVIALATLSRFSFPIVWSLLVALSYSAYANPNFTENGWLIAAEYGIVLSWLLLESINPALINSWNRKIWGETP